MAALTQDRATALREAEFYDGPMAASVTAYAGGIAVRDASGNVKPGVTATGLIAVGIFEETKTNGAVAGANRVKYREGCWRLNNSSAGDLIGNTEIGKVCYIVDDQTVAKTDGAGTRSKAGVVADVDTLGVWVMMGPGIIAGV